MEKQSIQQKRDGEDRYWKQSCKQKRYKRYKNRKVSKKTMNNKIAVQDTETILLQK